MSRFQYKCVVANVWTMSLLGDSLLLLGVGSCCHEHELREITMLLFIGTHLEMYYCTNQT
jgi:hypothetical protein